jgi:hypothetical protein
VGPTWLSGDAVWPAATQLRRAWVAHAQEVRNQHRNRGEVTLTSGPQHNNGWRWFEYNSNSNYFKIFQTLTDPKTFFRSPKKLK